MKRKDNLAISSSRIKKGRIYWNRSMRDAVRCVRKHRQLSRAQLAEELGLSPSSMTEMIRSLLKIGVLRTDEWVATPGRGRPQQMLKVGREGFYSLGISIGFEVDLVLLNPSFEEVAHQRFPNDFRDVKGTPEKGIRKLLKSIQKMIESISNGKLVEIGVSVSGDIFSDHTNIYSTNDFLNLEQARFFLEELRKLSDCPVKVINDAHVSVLAERWMNPELPVNPSLLYVTRRLGVGMILEGSLYEGPVQWSRSLSHFQVNREGSYCYCGEKGCLATTATPDVISERLVGRTWSDPSRSVQARKKDLEMLWDRYVKGDREIVEKIHRGLEDFSAALRNISTLFSFDAIIWEPWDERFSKDLLRRLEMASAAWLQRIPSKKIQVSVIGENQQAVGAGIFAMEDFFNNLLKNSSD
ncbi:MAG: ROK family protein [Verrucomicrobiota bacterium]